MPRYLLSESEVAALKVVVQNNRFSDALGHDRRTRRSVSNYPFRFKLLEAMGASTANKANAAIYFFGDSTANLYDKDDVIDDSSAFSAATSGQKGVCLASSVYHILEFTTDVTSSATEYIGLATTTYATTDASIVIDNLEPMAGTGTTSSTITANNKFEWDVVNNKPCYAKYNAHSSRYELLQTWCT